jgi:hypothetical protein
MSDQYQGGGLGDLFGGIGNRAMEDVAIGLIMSALRTLDYPLSKADLDREADRRGAPSQVTNVLKRMPDRQYTSADDVAAEARKAWKG